MPADKLHITLAGSEHVVEEGTTAGQALAGQPRAIAARVNGELTDLAAVLGDGDEVEPVGIDSPDGLNILRHSTAHVLAQAVQDLFPEAKQAFPYLTYGSLVTVQPGALTPSTSPTDPTT